MTKIDKILTIVRDYGNKNGWTKDEQAQFLAQMEHESMSFTRTRELSYRPERAYQLFSKRFGSLTNAKNIYSKSGPEGLFEVMYSGKNGNDKPGDGAKYIGRAYLQITGKGNYQLIKDETKIDVITNPSLLENEDMAVLASMVWWKLNVRKNIKNFSGESATTSITRIVNGPALLGLKERYRLYLKWVKIV